MGLPSSIANFLNPTTALQFLSWFLTNQQFQNAFGEVKDLFGETEQAATSLSDDLSAGNLLAGTGFDQPTRLGGINVGSQGALYPDQGPVGQIGRVTRGTARPGRFDLATLFTSADTFQEGLPEGGFEPIDIQDFRYDPTELQTLGRSLGEDLRGGAVDFNTLLEQSNVEGLTERAAERFPDYSAFRTERLGGIADAAREAQNQARAQLSGGFSSLEEGQTELARREFAGELSAGRAASGVESAVEALLGQKAVTLSGLEQAEALERGRLSTSAAGDARVRDLGAAEIEGRMFAQGETLGAGNLGLLADIERFNQTFQVDVASQGAQFTAQDEAKRFNALLSQMGARLGANTTSGQFQSQLLNMLGQLRADLAPPVLPLSTGFFDPALYGNPDQPVDDKSGGSLTIAGFGGGITCVDGASRIETPHGPRPLAKISVGDSVMAADGRFRRVIAKDYGAVPHEHRIKQLLIQTAQGWLSVTEDHPLGGRAARLWTPGDAVPMLGGRQRIIAVRTIPYRVSGDLMLEGNADYLANGFAVESAIGKIGLDRWNRFLAA